MRAGSAPSVGAACHLEFTDQPVSKKRSLQSILNGMKMKAGSVAATTCCVAVAKASVGSTEVSQLQHPKTTFEPRRCSCPQNRKKGVR